MMSSGPGRKGALWNLYTKTHSAHSGAGVNAVSVSVFLPAVAVGHESGSVDSVGVSAQGPIGYSACFLPSLALECHALFWPERVTFLRAGTSNLYVRAELSRARLLKWTRIRLPRPGGPFESSPFREARTLWKWVSWATLDPWKWTSSPCQDLSRH